MSAWVDQIFDSKIARRGGVVRRKITSIKKYASLTAVKKACRKRGYHIVRHGDQWLIFCDKALVKVVM